MYSTLIPIKKEWKNLTKKAQNTVCEWLLENERQLSMSIWDTTEEYEHDKRKTRNFGCILDIFSEFTFNPFEITTVNDIPVYLSISGYDFTINKEIDQKLRTFNGLSAKEWASLSSSVWGDVSSPRTKSKLEHGATFPRKLSDRLIQLYSHEGNLVLDPFLGTGTTIASAISLKREHLGIELTEKYYNIANEELEKEFPESSLHILKGDCEDMLGSIAECSVQLTVTSPPYANLIRKIEKDRKNTHKNSVFVTENGATTNPYSDNPDDLGNMELPDYIFKVERIMKELYRITKENGYCVWIVQDYRDTKHNLPYVNLHNIIADCGTKAGFVFHDLIIWDKNQHRKLVVQGYPSTFYVNLNHSFIVVLKKKVVD